MQGKMFQRCQIEWFPIENLCTIIKRIVYENEKKQKSIERKEKKQQLRVILKSRP